MKIGFADIDDNQLVVIHHIGEEAADLVLAGEIMLALALNNSHESASDPVDPHTGRSSATAGTCSCGSKS